jgi:hypothetical protein
MNAASRPGSDGRSHFVHGDAFVAGQEQWTSLCGHQVPAIPAVSDDGLPRCQPCAIELAIILDDK